MAVSQQKGRGSLPDVPLGVYIDDMTAEQRQLALHPLQPRRIHRLSDDNMFGGRFKTDCGDPAEKRLLGNSEQANCGRCIAWDEGTIGRKAN